MLQEALGINFDKDGEWWMSHKDFVHHFDQVEPPMEYYIL